MSMWRTTHAAPAESVPEWESTPGPSRQPLSPRPVLVSGRVLPPTPKNLRMPQRTISRKKGRGELEKKFDRLLEQVEKPPPKVGLPESLGMLIMAWCASLSETAHQMLFYSEAIKACLDFHVTIGKDWPKGAPAIADWPSPPPPTGPTLPKDAHPKIRVESKLVDAAEKISIPHLTDMQMRAHCGH